jgi:hypothetical protein
MHSGGKKKALVVLRSAFCSRRFATLGRLIMKTQIVYFERKIGLVGEARIGRVTGRRRRGPAGTKRKLQAAVEKCSFARSHNIRILASR